MVVMVLMFFPNVSAISCSSSHVVSWRDMTSRTKIWQGAGSANMIPSDEQWKNLVGYLGYIGDYIDQLCEDYSKLNHYKCKDPF